MGSRSLIVALVFTASALTACGNDAPSADRGPGPVSSWAKSASQNPSNPDSTDPNSLAPGYAKLGTIKASDVIPKVLKAKDIKATIQLTRWRSPKDHIDAWTVGPHVVAIQLRSNHRQLFTCVLPYGATVENYLDGAGNLAQGLYLNKAPKDRAIVKLPYPIDEMWSGEQTEPRDMTCRAEGDPPKSKKT